ncbi:MAG: vanadium-dependent haloperoxidase [Solirubrobacteraceae bacterium]
MVISDWNALAATTFTNDPTKVPQETPLYMGFVQAAVYDAVVGIDRRYEPYRFDARAPHRTSAQAAAVAAAHKVLVTYSPYAQATLDAAYAAALAQIPDGKAKTRGIAFGTLAADNLIAMRANDGRNAPVLFTQPPAPGVWRPTPPALLPMAVPWMGSVTPLLVRSGAQFGEPGPPPALTSARYTRDFDEVKALGSATSTARTPEQTNSALFFSGNAAVQFNAALRDQMTVRHPDIVDAARMFAAVDMSEADAIISVWHAKYLYGFWRPITAINLADTDGNPATTADRNWTPLLTTPPYPDYVSGYSGLTGAFTQALEEALDTRHLQLTLTSTAVPGAVRSYDSGKSLRNDVVDARVWLGIHFRTADTGGVEMGQRVADWALTHYFGAREDH